MRAATIAVLAAAALLAGPPRAGADGAAKAAKVTVRRPEAIAVMQAPPAGLESGGTAVFKATLKGGFGSPWIVITDSRGDVFFPETDRLKMDGATLTATLDFPGEDGEHRVDVIAAGPKGEEEVASFTIAVGVAPRATTDESGTGVVPTPAPPSGQPPPPNPGGGMSAGERLLLNRRAASIACVDELARVREGKGLEPVFHDQRIHVVCMEVAREMGNKGRFGPSEVRMKPGTRASIFHGWGLGIYDNYTGSYKSIFSPADVVKRLGGSLAKGSMFSKGGVNVGGFGFWENSKNPAEVYIVMGLAKDSKLRRIRAAQARVAKARDELAKAEGAARVKVVKGVAGLRSIEAAPFLAEVLAADPDPDVRIAATAGLQSLGDPSIVQPLIDAITGEDEKVDEAAGRALQRITGRRYGADQRKWTAWWDIERDFFRRRK